MASDPASSAQQILLRVPDQLGTHALILLDVDGVVLGWMAGGERLFGYAADEIVGKNIDILFTPEDLAKDLSNWELKTAAASGESEDDRWQMRKDGGRIWVSGTLTAVRDEADRPLGFVKITRNRTDQKIQVEALESRVAALESAREHQRNFASTLAHELRTPLAAIAGAAQIASADPASPESGKALAIIGRQVEFMGRLIGQLLETTRAAAGKLKLQRERIVLQDVIHHAVETSQPALQSNGHELRLSLADVPLELEADAVRIRQVLVNLIENAAKNTPPGRTIWIKASAEGEEAVVRVQDNGRGIPPEIMPHIFELFTQAEPSSQQPSGLGIGLAVVKDTVDLHGGSVQATSDGVGKGSEFTIRLPMCESSADFALRGPQDR